MVKSGRSRWFDGDGPAGLGFALVFVLLIAISTLGCRGLLSAGQDTASLPEATQAGTQAGTASGAGQNAEAAEATAALIAGLTGLAIVIGAVSVWHSRRRSARLAAGIEAMTGDLSRVFTGMAEGDLTRQVPPHRDRTFEKMADDVNATIEKLSGMVARIHDAAEAIAAAAAEVAAGGGDLSERTERQAAALEQTAAAFVQLSDTFKSYCEHAREANAMVGDARDAGEQGVRVVAAAIESMQRIVEGSEKIKGIIRVTEEISRRINMLAINASVEAARAGEAGKGFGVVAREVGSLAERSAQASQQIKELIFSSDSQIQQGVHMVTQSGSALQTIVGSVDRAAALFNDIALSAAAQSGMINEINAAISQLDETTQMNAALAEQTCAASQSMHSEAAGMKELVSFFILESRDTSHGFGRDIVLIESTKLDHLSFMKRIREAIAGQRDTCPDDLPDHHHCRLGKWYDTIEAPVVRLNAAYRTLERPHALVHDAAKWALQRHAAGDQTGCDQALEEMTRASAQVLALIDDLAGDLRDYNHAEQGGARAPVREEAPRRPRPSRRAGTPPQRHLLADDSQAPPRPRGVLRHADAGSAHEWTEF